MKKFDMKNVQRKLDEYKIELYRQYPITRPSSKGEIYLGEIINLLKQYVDYILSIDMFLN